VALKIDIFGMEFSAGLPNWLTMHKGHQRDKPVQHGPNVEAIRAKHREAHLASRKQPGAFQRAALNLFGRR
jgi:hypothetical protein